MTHTIIALIKRVLAVNCIFTTPHNYTLDGPSTILCTSIHAHVTRKSWTVQAYNAKRPSSNAHETCTRRTCMFNPGGRHPRVRGRASSQLPPRDNRQTASRCGAFYAAVGGEVDLYGATMTTPKRRTQKWHLSNAAWAPSGHTQNHGQRDGACILR